MDRPEMGACEHEGVRWTKQGPRGIIEIWLPPWPTQPFTGGC